MTFTPLVDTAYEKVLADLAERHQQRAQQVLTTQPPYTPLIDKRLEAGCTPALHRMLKYLWVRPGGRTDEISSSCAIGNVSDTVHSESGATALRELGLMVICETERSRNRYGHKTVIGRWWIVFDDLSKLYGEAANDADHDVKVAADQ